MKTKFLLMAFAATLFLNSCSSSDDEDVIVTPPLGSGEIGGQATANKTFIKGNYTLSGVYKIKAGVTVTLTPVQSSLPTSPTEPMLLW
jgi:hypothetical protein